MCKNHDYYYVEMPKEDNKILCFGEKLVKIPFIIYADLESLLEKMNTCHNNPKTLSTTKINKHTASGYSLFTNCSIDTTKNKLNYHRGKSCIKNFCQNLKERATKIINNEKKEMLPLANEERILYRQQKVCYICKKGFSANDDNKKYQKIRDHCHSTAKYRGAAHDICNLRHKTQKEIS